MTSNAGPITFGATRTFRVRNTGLAPLAARLRKLPKGFELVEPLDPLLMPGESDTFTIRLATTSAGSFSRKFDSPWIRPTQPCRYSISPSVER